MVNAVQLIGRLARDPTADQTSGGKPAVSLRVAVPRRHREHADFITVVAYDGLAETAARYLVSGRQIGVVGRLHHTEWRSDDDQRRERVEVVAAAIEFLDAPTADRR